MYLRTLFAKLKNSSAYKTLLNNSFLPAFHLLLLILGIENPLGFIFYLLFGYWLYRKDKILFWCSLAVSMVFLCIYLFLEVTYQFRLSEVIEGKIIDLKRNEDYNKITVRQGLFRSLIYDYHHHDLRIGDRIIAMGKPMSADPQRIESGFDYAKYLRHEKVISSLMADTVEVRDSSFAFGRIKTAFEDYLAHWFSGDSLVFMKAMLIGDDSGFSEEFSEAVTDNGILHLFAVSGLHIVLIVDLLNRIFHYFGFKKTMADTAICVFLFIFLILTDFSPSVLRAALTFYLSFLNRKIKLGFSPLDILSWAFIFLLMQNPYYMYNLGFCLSFSAAAVILLLSPLIKKYPPVAQTFIISVAVMMATFPIVNNINNELNLLSPVTNVAFIELTEGIILPLSIFVAVFPIFRSFYGYAIQAFIRITVFTSEVLIIPLRFPDISFLFSTVYFLFLYLIIRSYQIKKRQNAMITVLVLFLTAFSYSCILKPDTTVSFLDLYNGESTLIQTAGSECTALIDTGDGRNREVTSFLKSRGIRKIDYLFLTHNHDDHNGEAKVILKEFRVKNVVVSPYDTSDYSRLIQSIQARAGSEYSCGNINFQIVHPEQNDDNENDRSLVIASEIGSLRFLFLGDISRSSERILLSKNLKADLIKIAHHGSATSTDPFFISSLHPRYAVIQTGRIEKFGFPNHATIETLNRYHVEIFRTDINYSVEYRFRNGKGKFYTVNSMTDKGNSSSASPFSNKH